MPDFVILTEEYHMPKMKFQLQILNEFVKCAEWPTSKD